MTGIEYSMTDKSVDDILLNIIDNTNLAKRDELFITFLGIKQARLEKTYEEDTIKEGE